MSEEDDKTTVVVNIKDLKKHYEELDVTKDISDLEFLTDQTKEKNNNNNVLLSLFDYKSNTLKEMLEKGIIPEYAKILKTTQELNEFIKTDSKKYILFNYHIEPKAINTLMAQINKISKNTKTIIVAKGLTEEFIQKHKASASKATNYLNFPFKLADLEKILKV